MAGPGLPCFGFVLLVAGAIGMSMPPVASASFPGRNGRIAYSERGSSSSGTGPCTGNYGSIFVRWPGQRARNLAANDDWEDVTAPAFSPSGRRLAVGVSYCVRDGIYTASGLGPVRWRRLTRARGQDGVYDLNPDWSRDGRIVFERLRVDDPEDRARASIRLYRRGGSHRISAGRDPAWSVRGSIAFVKAEGAIREGCTLYDMGTPGCGSYAVHVMRSNGSGVRRLAAGLDPDWSPDGKRIVFSTPAGDLALVRPSGQGLRLITRSGAKLHRYPAFSPDGKKIVFVSGPTPNPEWQPGIGPPSEPFEDWADSPSRLYVIRLKSGALRKVARATPFWWIEAPDWQPLPRRRQR